MAPKKRGRKKNPLAYRVAKLERENRRLQQKLKQAELIIEAQKKKFGDPGNLSGSEREQRKQMISLAEQLSPHVGKKAACNALQVPRATFYRHHMDRVWPVEEKTKRPFPSLALSRGQRQTVIDILHS